MLFLLLLLPTLALPARAQEAVGDHLTTGAAQVAGAARELTEASLSDLERQIQFQDRQIFLELVKLAKFNVTFQQTVNHCARWRKFFYPMAQEAGYGCFLAYSISDLSQRARGWNAPAKISEPTAKRAISAAMVGALLGASSSLLELAANGAETVHARQNGFSVRQSVSFVLNTIRRVDEMLEKRHALMEQVAFTGTRRELLQLKEELLKYERDRLIFEFKRWSVHSRGYAWYKNSFYLINATVNLARFSAAPVGFKAFTQPRCAGATGPILLTASCLAGLGPAASSAIANGIERHQGRILNKKLPVSSILSDQEVRRKFDRLAQLLVSSQGKDEHNQIAVDLIRLREEKLGLDTIIFHEEKNIERLRLVAGQQAITAPFISSLGAASAVQNTIAYHAYRHAPLTNNRLGLTADATIIPAELVALVATPKAAIKAHLYERDLKSKNEHPEQLLAKRLKDLQALEAMLTELLRVP